MKVEMVPEQGPGESGVRRVIAASLQPYQRWQEKRQLRSKVDAEVQAIREEAAARLRALHEALWQGWNPKESTSFSEPEEKSSERV